MARDFAVSASLKTLFGSSDFLSFPGFKHSTNDHEKLYKMGLKIRREDCKCSGMELVCVVVEQDFLGNLWRVLISVPPLASSPCIF